MIYFEDKSWETTGDSRCSFGECPLGADVIPRGEGYLYVSVEVVEFRWHFRSYESACAEMDRRIREKYGRPVSYNYRIGPVLLCEKCARQKGLDLVIAAADARYWWETGMAPLRATPLAGSRLAEEERQEMGL